MSLSRLPDFGISGEMSSLLESAPEGACVGWGIPFEIGNVVAIREEAVEVSFEPTGAQWLVFMHTSDRRQLQPEPDGFFSHSPGEGQLNEHAADYIVLFRDGTEERLPIRRRHQVGSVQRRWGENCFQAVAHQKPYPKRAAHEQLIAEWGKSQTRVALVDGSQGGQWINWLWAWKNPHPQKEVAGIRFEPRSGILIVSAVSAGSLEVTPLRWQSRRKVCFRLPEGESFSAELSDKGLLKQIQLDLGQVISASPLLEYQHDNWPESYNNQIPEISQSDVIIEYTAHSAACFHLADGSRIPVRHVENSQASGSFQVVAPSKQRVTVRVMERESGKEVPVKLHVHGEYGEYLPPVDRHRNINPAWFEDYSVDFSHLGIHSCSYIPGFTRIDMPLGNVYIEVSKGFEIRPVRKVINITQGTEEIIVEVEKVLPWRERGWVTADTHVHFLSTASALLEGAAEGVNVVNLLASQWGELMTNVGDFDGKTTWGSKEAGGDGEYLVRVGTENRQHVLGHISLLGYRGRIIAPMTTGGPDESALGDPVEVLLTEWARQCRKQDGLVVLPHFPDPRAEHAASIVSGDVDALEMTSWDLLYNGIDPYSLSDWYRYLNCGYLVAAVGGTDKMMASTAVGTVRTYARIDPDTEFTYKTWMDAVKRAETFVTYGPLMEFSVNELPMGSKIEMTRNGGTVDVSWKVASVTIPLSRIELIVNGEIRESLSVSPWEGKGHWSVNIDKSSWLALLVRGHYADKPEIVAAHSTPVMIHVEGTPMLAKADALTILEQIEGAMAYIDTIGTRAEETAYKRMNMVLTSAHRTLHNRLHQMGRYHEHTVTNEHS